MAGWDMEQVRNIGGRFQIIFSKLGSPNVFGLSDGTSRDVTFFRKAPTTISSFSSADPFGDATAQLVFPAITGYDDLDSQEIGSWLADYSDVDIWWIPGTTDLDVPLPAGVEMLTYINPLTNQQDCIAPVYSYTDVGGVVKIAALRGVKVFEGFVASMDLEGADDSNSLSVSVQGALFQADRYMEKPFFPAGPQTLESLIQAVFDHGARPHLRTQPLVIEWPTGWTKVAPALTGAPNDYTSNATPGAKWTGYTSRSTGAWDRSLTGFCQDQISTMLTTEDSGVTPGNQWTILQALQGDPNYPAGRTPLLKVRDKFATPDFAMWYGTPGMKCSLTKDTTQSANIYYGDGTDLGGQVWRNAVVAHDGSRTDYLPLAADPSVYPPINNPSFDKGAFASEAYLKFGTGFNQPDAVTSSQKIMQRTLRSSWAGTITLSTDPSADLPRWLIRAGMTMRLMGFSGSGADGVSFHIASVECDPSGGTVQLTVDTQYRDLLTLAQAIARTRDPLTPSKLLQINRATAIIQDLQAPWDYKAGSGFIPKASTAFYAYCPTNDPFPYNDWCQKHPPFLYPQWYVACNANAADSNSRWSGPIPILTAEKGTIARSEFYCVNKFGQIVKNPFHVSLYYVNVHSGDMPRDTTHPNQPSPYLPGAFESINPATGLPWPDGTFLAPQPSYIIGWGNALQPAGFSPGLYSAGAQPTGLLADDFNWQFDNSNTSNQANYDIYAKVGKEPVSAITIYAMFYAQYTEDVYFQGRLFLQPQGAS
jgi:hypothetical protein